jgi:hypothetical protein
MVGEATKPYYQGGEYDCRVRMRRFANYLLVEDNHICGGVNASFTGTPIGASESAGARIG